MTDDGHFQRRLGGQCSADHFQDLASVGLQLGVLPFEKQGLMQGEPKQTALPLQKESLRRQAGQAAGKGLGHAQEDGFLRHP
jgi:hypothetical protein